jgi:hypothetical protein
MIQSENQNVPQVRMLHEGLPEPTKGNSLAIASLVLGILAAVLCWIPFLGLLALPFGALGLLLGVIALLVAIVGRSSGLAFSLAGIGTSLGAIFLSFSITSAASKAISDAMEAEAGPVAQASTPVGTTAGAPIQPAHSRAGTADVPPSAPDKKEAEWVMAPTPVQLGGVEVKVVSAKVAPVALRGPTGEGRSEESQLILTIEVTNTKQNRKIDYRTWAGGDVSFDRDFAMLKDNFKNNYKRITFGIFDRPIGRVVSESIYPGKNLRDVLVFEAPLDNVEYLDLDMPGKNVNEDGIFKIRIPATMIGESGGISQRRAPTKSDGVDAGPEKGVSVAEAGFPSIEGVWQEGPEENRIRVTVKQNAETFTATCTYRDREHGEISWRMTGTISREGEIQGNLVHTKAPRGWLNQTRTGRFSPTTGVITGYAVFPGGKHAFEWKHLEN